MKRRFEKSLTLRLSEPIQKRANVQLARFPFTNPHALGLHLFTVGLEVSEASLIDSEAAPGPAPRTARQHNAPHFPRRGTAPEHNAQQTGEVKPAKKGGAK